METRNALQSETNKQTKKQKTQKEKKKDKEKRTLTEYGDGRLI